MAREPELSIKVKVDPTIDRDKFQQDIDKLIPDSNPIKINGAFDADKVLRSITEYQNKTGKDVPIFAKISNIDALLDSFNGKSIDVSMTVKQASLDTIKTQLQSVIDGLDLSKLQNVSVTPNVTQQAADALKVDIQTKLGAVDITPDITDVHIKAIRQKIETELNKIKFNPWPSSGPGSKSKGSGGNGRTSKESELARNLAEQSQILNKQDAAANGKHYRNVNVQRGRKSDLEIQEANNRAELAKSNPNYQNEDWYNKAVLKAKYIRDDYTSTQADKADLDIVKKLNEAFKENIALRKKLSRISKSQSPQDWNNVNSGLRKSNHTVAKTGQQAVRQGVYLGNIKQNYANQVKVIEEKARNALFEQFENELKQYISSGHRYANATGDKNYEKATRLWSEQNSHKTNLDNITKEMYARGYDKYDPQDNSGTYQKFIKLTQSRTSAENELAIAIKDRSDAQKDAASVDNSDVSRLAKITAQLERQKHTLEASDEGRASGIYNTVTKNSSLSKSLTVDLDANQGVNKDLVARNWANKNGISGIKSLADAYEYLRKEVDLASIEVEKFSDETTKSNRRIQNEIRVSNIQSQLHDYLEKYPKVEKKLNDQVSKLQNGLASPNASNNVKELSKQMAELRARAKDLGLETENLLDKFEKLFGQHLSTMITMAALHQMQNALRIVYQNVVDIDTAITELRKVSEYTGRSLEEYMDRAANQAQKLGVSISAYINSTADWKRLGYSDEDAENLATYSTLLKNVGDGIDDVNTSSSYLISTLQGFGLLADQAENVVNKIDAVANTQPVTANDLGEILTRSSAAMSAANNTLEETIALGTAANSVIQDADTVGTTLKSLSMYLRAAKTDAEAAGIEVDGMANSVSELRTELKSLTGVDIMLDSKNFKSTYQIMKELSQVWGNLSDVTQANVTEMIGGKRNANAVSAILNNFSVAESAMESAANSANVAWEENEKYLDSIQGRLAQLDASFQALSTDILYSDLVKSGVSFLTTVVKLIDKLVDLTGALPLGLGIGAFATQLGRPKMTGFMIVPSNTPGGNTEQVCCSFYWHSVTREYLVKPTNMAA